MSDIKVVHFVVDGSLNDSLIKTLIDHELSALLTAEYQILNRNESKFENGNLHFEYLLELNPSEEMDF
jgi:hypothetical protein